MKAGKEFIGEFRHESIQDRASLVTYLQSIADGVKSGKITFKDNGKQLIIEPLPLSNLEIKAKRSGKKSKLTLKMSWKEKKELSTSGMLSIED